MKSGATSPAEAGEGQFAAASPFRREIRMRRLDASLCGARLESLRKGRSGDCSAKQAVPSSGRARSGTPANSLFFRPIFRKQNINNHTMKKRLLSFFTGFCVATGRTFRTAAVPQSQAVQGVARIAAAPRPAVPAIFFKRWNGLSRSGKRANPLFFRPICRNRILNGRAKTKNDYPAASRFGLRRRTKPVPFPSFRPEPRIESGTERRNDGQGIDSGQRE